LEDLTLNLTSTQGSDGHGIIADNIGIASKLYGKIFITFFIIDTYMYFFYINTL